MLLEIHPFDPQTRLIDQVIEILKKDGVIIYPTDTTYTFCCAIHSKKAMKRIYQLKNINKKKLEKEKQERQEKLENKEKQKNKKTIRVKT